jgi:hypothetical protein
MKITSSYEEIANKEEISNDIIKPIHQYAQKISPKPQLKDGVFVQEVYSESLVSINNGDTIKMVSRPAIQQYRVNSDAHFGIPDDCFRTLFEFYISWFPDIDKEVMVSSPRNTESPFLIPQGFVFNFGKLYANPKTVLTPVWVPFFLKKDFLVFKKNYSKIELGSVAYQMEIL